MTLVVFVVQDRLTNLDYGVIECLTDIGWKNVECDHSDATLLEIFTSVAKFFSFHSLASFHNCEESKSFLIRFFSRFSFFIKSHTNRRKVCTVIETSIISPLIDLLGFFWLRCKASSPVFAYPR